MAVISLSHILEYWAHKCPDRIAITHNEHTIDWHTLDKRSNQLARVYAENGVGQDDFVSIALPNSIGFFEATFAVWKLGATPQPISAKLPKRERDQIINVAKPRLIIGTEDQSTDSIPSLPVGFEAPSKTPDTALEERTALSYKAMTSGGSTGLPKVIVSKQPATVDPDADFFRFVKNGSMLVPGPLYHNGPFLWAVHALFKGSQVTITTRFDAIETLALIEKWQVDTIYTVPTMMQRIWNLPDETRRKYDLSSLKTLWHLAAPCPAWLKENYIDWLGPDVICELYGGTEGIGTTMISGREWLEHRGSVGKPVESCEIKIVGEDGQTLPPREMGEVFMKPIAGPGTSYRYVGAEAKAIDGGWESLGDLGYLDEDGYLYLSDRLTDMILSGGANIYPAEVEAAIEAFPGVRSSAVIGLPHEDLGNAVHAIVDIQDTDCNEDDLLAHLGEHLVRYKIPRSIEIVRQPLRDDSGKVRRRSLREKRLKENL